jgi:hypothetical protein
MDAEVLDPRFDDEPAYWSTLRERAGLHGDWAWDVLVTQAWCARTPQLYTVFHGDDGPAGVVASAWVGPSTRRHRFVGNKKTRVGMLDVRSPGSGSVPGWWFADGAGAGRIVGEYAKVMRKHLGPGLRGMLVRQVGEAERGAVDGRFRLLRRTENIGMLDLQGVTTLADWTARLSKNRRANLRKMTTKFTRDGTIEHRVVAGPDLDPVEVGTLMRVNYDKHRDVPILPLPQFIAYLEVLLAQPDVLVLAYYEQPGDRLVALTLVYDHPQWPIARSWASYPQGRGGRSNLYFYNVIQLVEWAIGAQKHGIVMGKKLSDVKQSLGMDPLPQYALATLL